MIIESPRSKEILAYFMDLPLIEVLDFPGVSTDIDPQAILEKLVNQVHD